MTLPPHASPMTADELDRYAQAIVSGCLHVGPSDLLAIHAEPAHRELAVALTEAAYRAGCDFVDVFYTDPRVRRARIALAPEATLAEIPEWQMQRMRDIIARRGLVISINGEGEPGLLSDLDPRRAAQERLVRPGYPAYSEAVMAGELAFCVVGWPTPGWAERAYPELPAEAALRRLADDVLRFGRLGPEDPPDAWTAHIARLDRLAAELTERRFSAIRLRGDGTDLTVRLAPDSRWASAEEATAWGRSFCANFPTEEIFTTPDPRGTEGAFRCTRSLGLEGRAIDGIRGVFRDGRLERIEADRPADQAFLEAYLSKDPGAGRLGELALLDHSSRIGQSGRRYGVTLLDENAASHIAFGSGYALGREAGGASPEINQSEIHVDVMIGSDELEVDGVTADGATVALIRGGGWCISP